jgi:hypothetical protein
MDNKTELQQDRFKMEVEILRAIDTFVKKNPLFIVSEIYVKNKTYINLRSNQTSVDESSIKTIIELL